MSLPTRNPLRLVGAVPNSGFPNTGEQATTRGGMQTATVFSGGLLSPGSGFLPQGTVKTADQLLLVSGAGRLNTVFLHGTGAFTLSGVQLAIYDGAAVDVSGATPTLLAAGGKGFLALMNGPAGLSGQTIIGQSPVSWDMPFSSGLCVSCISGSPGFTLSYTRETNNPIA
jgi:hypothetical protein